VKAIATEHLSYLQAAQLRLRYFDSCPAIAVWVCFWHDVWHSNQDMKLLTEEEDSALVLNPWLPGSLAWNVECEENVNKRLQAAGLQTESGSGFIQKDFVASVYKMMHEVTANPPAPATKVDMSARPEGQYFEVMKHPAYASSLVPLFLTEIQAPGLQWIRTVADHNHDFYDPEFSKMTLMQGGQQPAQAQAPPAAM
jgi:hypothetical protein